MRPVVFASIVTVAVVASIGSARAESASCQAQLKRQDEQCQLLAEKLEAACPDGQNIKDNPACREISNQIASTCTRKPCAPPPRKKRARSKSKSMGMGTSRAMGKPKTRSGEGKK